MFHQQATAFAGYPLGGELVGGAALGVRALDRGLLVGFEGTGSTVVTNSSAFGALRQTPIEALFGFHATVASDWRIGAGAGAGLTRGFGEPALRILAAIEWFPAIPPPAPPPVEAEVASPPPDRDKDDVP